MNKSEENKLNVSIENVHNIARAQYTDGDMAFIDDISKLPEGLQNNIINNVEMIVFVFCFKGKMSVSINSVSAELHEGNILFCGPDSVIDDCMISPDFDAKILCISTRIILSLVRSDKNILNHYFSVMKHPVIRLGEDGIKLFEYYYNMMKYHMELTDRTYNKEVMSALVSAALYDLLSEKGTPEVQLGNNNVQITQGEQIYRRFMELLSANCPRERSVSWYARQLCITPKYLSTAVRQASGRTAMKWITDFVVKDIRRLLEHSDLTIKEISDQLDFPNLSFFGKYVKQHLGVSPKEYRRRQVCRPESNNN